MIRKLRRQFVAVCMALVALVLAAVFGSAYHAVRQNIEDLSRQMLQQVLTADNGRGASPGMTIEIGGDQILLPYFTVNIWGDTAYITGGTYADLEDTDVLKNILSQCLAQGTAEGTVSDYHLRYLVQDNGLYRKLAFVDMSMEQAVLIRLVRSYLVIALAAMLVLLAIAVAASHWVTRPVERAWKQQRQFVADASHELKTPLTVIMTNAELLNSPDFDQARRSQFAAHILTMSRQMRQLIEEMLDLARTDNGQGTLAFSPVDLSRLVNDAVLPFEPVFFERGLTLTADIQEHITVSGSQQHLRQITDILLDNAQKYSSPAGEVTVQLTRQGGRCRLSVSNPGDVLSKAERKDIFKRFYRTDEAHSQRGSYGLGLSIAANIAAMHRGKIWVESSNGRNIFHLELPVKSGGRCGAGQSS